MKKIMVIAAHPDDDVLGCGGTIAKLTAEGAKVHVVFLGEGSTSRFAPGGRSPEMEAAIRTRRNYAEKALEIMGAQSSAFFDNPCGKFDQVSVLELGQLIEKEIENFRPDTIFTHSPHDVNMDHRLSFQATLQATRPGARNYVERLYTFEVLSSSEWRYVEAFQPNFFVKLSPQQLETKVRALAAYTSEVRPFPFPRSEEGLRTLAKMRGMQCGAELAEGFQLVREFRA